MQAKGILDTHPIPSAQHILHLTPTVPPAVYHDLAEVFSKDLALTLPPQRPYDCGIDLLLRAPLPTSHLYSLSKPKWEAMEH